MKLKDHLPKLEELRNKFLSEYNLSATAITTGRDAWTVAHRAGITNYCYNLSRDVTDAHIQTALEALFPEAVFQDKKRY